MNPLVERFGKTADLGPCVLGQNLNVLVLRGFANLQVLSCLSGPDVYDEELNEMGTQRELAKPHAVACFDYAVEAPTVNNSDDPRCFPELLLNARDRGVIEIYDVRDPDRSIDFHSLSDIGEFDSQLVGVRIRVDLLEYPTPQFNPKISRVDGNHRLSGVDIDSVLSEEDDDSNIIVPFSLLVGLDTNQEVKLFRDINGEHKGMDVTHLMNISTRLEGDTLAESDRTRHIWLARKLMAPNHAFEGMVFLGGSRAGVLQRYGRVPPLKLNTLASALRLQLNHAALTRNSGLSADALAIILNNYWSAVREVFPAEWEDKRNFILLQTIGLNGFAELGGVLVDEAFRTRKLRKEHYLAPLRAIKEKVSLARDDEQWRGVAGAGGAKRVAQALIGVASGSDVDRIAIESELGVDSGIVDLSSLD